MTATTQTKIMTYDDALDVFLATRGSYGGGLSNHGPMVTEALVHMDAERWIGPFVTAYRPRLEEREARPFEPFDWRDLLRTELPALCSAAAAEAGHGLLRVAHAVRGIERAEAEGVIPAVRLAELRAAIGYWKVGGPGIPSPELVGARSAGEWAQALGPLATFDPLPGLLTGTLELAASQPEFASVAASLAPPEAGDEARTIDELARLAAAGYLRNEEFLSRFTLLHGVTVSTMSHVLLAHLEGTDRQRLVAAVAGFVAAAVVGFDRPSLAPTPAPPIRDDLADRAGATLDDHTIKFSDACLGLAARTGDEVPLRAAELQIALTS